MLAEKFKHRLKNRFVFLEVERGWHNNIEHVIDSIGTKHDRTKKRHLRLHGVWRDAQTGLVVESYYLHRPIVAPPAMAGQAGKG